MIETKEYLEAKEEKKSSVENVLIMDRVMSTKGADTVPPPNEREYLWLMRGEIISMADRT